MILVSLFGTVISFCVLAFADTIGRIYVARALAGFFAASIVAEKILGELVEQLTSDG